MNNNIKKIIIFGGSFNPFHTGHLKLIKKSYKILNADELWLIPTKKNPFKKDILNIKDNELINMINLGINGLSYVKIIKYELENNLSKKNYSINTVEWLLNKNPNYKFYFLIGSDILKDLSNWKDINKLSNLVQLVVFPRMYFNLDQKIITKYNIKVINIPTINLSSSDIRNGKNIDLQIKKVNDYINKKGFYLKDRLQVNLTDSNRLIHSLNVGEKSVELAKKYNVNQQEAKIAGTLHDITKNWDLKKHYIYIKKYCNEFLKEPISTLHSYSAYCYLKYELKYNDRIANAVKFHTTASTNMSDLDKIIFIADKISKERKYYKNLKYFRKLSLENLHLSFIKILKNQYKYVVTKNGLSKIGNQIKKSYQKYVNYDQFNLFLVNNFNFINNKNNYILKKKSIFTYLEYKKNIFFAFNFDKKLLLMFLNFILTNHKIKIKFIFLINICNNEIKNNNKLYVINKAFDFAIDVSDFGYKVGQLPKSLPYFQPDFTLIKKLNLIFKNLNIFNAITYNNKINKNILDNWINLNFTNQDIKIKDNYVFNFYFICNFYKMKSLAFITNSNNIKQVIDNLIKYFK